MVDNPPGAPLGRGQESWGGGSTTLTDHDHTHHRTAGFGNRTRGMPPDICHSSIGQRRRFATRSSAASGDTATGFPTARSSARSECESAYA